MAVRDSLLFTPEPWHNHASCLVELPNGDLLACWYHGSGEREADDVIVEGARLPFGGDRWSERFLMADTPGYPDCNPCMFVDRRGRLWLVYVTILANEWHTALLKYRVSVECDKPLAPAWTFGEVLHVTPGEEFVSAVNTTPRCEWGDRVERLATDKLTRRLGWMPRAHATVLDSGRIVLPLYSDGFDFSLMLLSDDNGDSWHVSAPLVSFGGVQPSVVQRRDGSLVAYMRDNGPPPNRIMTSESRDVGDTWSEVRKTDIPNPGSGLEAIRLASGRWLMVCNDTEQHRHRLAVLASDDEGATWQHFTCLEDDTPAAGSYSYPSIIQSRDCKVHVTYSYHKGGVGAIKWVWLREPR